MTEGDSRPAPASAKGLRVGIGLEDASGYISLPGAGPVTGREYFADVEPRRRPGHRHGTCVSLGLFEAITTTLPRPVMLCAGHGTILATNPAAAATISASPAGAQAGQAET